MKKMKKLASILLAAIMVLAMAVPAMAEKVTVESTDGIISDHTFTVYQIFTGKSQGEGSTAIGDLDWGSGVKDNILDALAEIDEFASCETAQDVAKVLADNSKTTLAYKFTDAIMAVDEGSHEYKYLQSPIATDLGNDGAINAIGYYLFIDTTDPVGEGGVYNGALLQVTGSSDEIQITVKTDKPSSEKKVQDVNDSVENSTSDWQDSADYDIGDSVPFQLTGTLPKNVNEYDSYKLVFHDKESEGLDFEKDSVVVKLNGIKVEDTGLYQVVTDGLEDGCTFEVVITDVKLLGASNSDKITVEYTSKLNESAKIGVDGNPNTMYMEYSNNPNVGGEGDTGKTKGDTVIVFTYQTNVDKVDGELSPLAGAEFTLYKYAPHDPEAIKDEGELNGWVKHTMTGIDGSQTSFEFKGLDDGKYKLVETVVPEGYNKAADVEFTVTADHEVVAEQPKLNGLTTDNETLTVQVKDGTLTRPDRDEKELKSGTIFGEVVNNKGAELPETGGIGTTIFYVLGSILVLGAVILLVTKRRMSVEK